MRLRVLRVDGTRTRTIGVLIVDGYFVAYVLEDALRSGPKVPGETAIPVGRYQVLLTMSQRFGRVLPLLVDVPQFTGIRFHGGNDASDTRGCPMVGDQRGIDTISVCAPALDRVIRLIERGLADGPVWCQVENVLDTMRETSADVRRV
jgi:hypothetical protein